MRKKTNMIFSLFVCLSVTMASIGVNPSRGWAEEIDIAEITKKVYPSVVKVEVRNGMRKIATGVVVDKDGYIVTTALISPRDAKLYVITADGERAEAEFLGLDSVTHLALIRSKDKKLQPLEKGRTEDISPGSWIGVVSISPEGTPAVTQGIVSSLSQDKLRLNVWVTPGASGSPVVDKEGRLVGLIRGAYFNGDMTLSIVQRTAEGVFVDRSAAPSSGMAMAIPVHLIRDVCEEIRKEGKMRRGWLGVIIVENDAGEVEIAEIEEESPAELSNLKEGDVVLEFEGKEVTSTKMLADEIRMKKPGEDVTINIKRKDKTMKIDVKLGEYSEKDVLREFEFKFPRLFSKERIRPDKVFKFEEPNIFRWQAGDHRFIGVYVQELNRELSDHFGVKEGSGLLISKIEEESPAAEAGLEVGDVIVKADGQRVENTRELSALIQNKEKGEDIEIEFLRDKKKKKAKVKIEEEEGRFQFFSNDWHGDADAWRGLSEKLQKHYKDYSGKFREHTKKYSKEVKKQARRINEDIQKRLKDLYRYRCMRV
jgi:S1-C subfamily serine protease